MLVRAVVMLCFVALFVAPARADLYSAQRAYHEGDFEAAYRLFRELAELGQPMAQFNLAVLYARGEGAPLSNTFAYAWAMLAADGGHTRGKELADELRPQLTAGSLQIAEEIRADFGRAALDERLMPRFSEAPIGVREGCRLQKGIGNAYPEEARRRGIQGHVYVEYVIMPDGRSRHARILLSVPPNQFDEAVRRYLRRSTFVPGTVDGQVVPCANATLFRFELQGEGDYSRLTRLMRETQVKAEAGDPAAQTLYGVLIAGLPQSPRPRSEALPWFLKAAQSGQPFAQYQIGSSLMMGWGCECEEDKGLVWLRKAAEADQPDAQVSLASYALRGTPGEENVARASVWLERAAAQDHHDAKVFLAALLAAAPSKKMRDPRRALELLEPLFERIDEEPTSYEIRAAALASLGDFSAATKDQTRAVDAARKLGWDLSPQLERLERYRTGQAWYGDLLGMANTTTGF
jgi:uncharacterized protein